jgi:5-methylcytosine-specific restriction protein A
MPKKLPVFRPPGSQTRQERTKQYNKYERDPELNKWYNSRAWRKCRAAFLAENPLCAHCLKKGRTTPSFIADHIIPLKQDFNDPFNWANLQALCRSCHNTKTFGGEA